MPKTLPSVLIDSIRATAVAEHYGLAITSECEIKGMGWFTARPLRPFEWGDLRPRLIGAWRVFAGRALAVQFAQDMPMAELSAWLDMPSMSSTKPAPADEVGP